MTAAINSTGAGKRGYPTKSKIGRAVQQECRDRPPFPTRRSSDLSVSCAYTQGKREQFSGFNRTLDAINNVFRKFSAFHDETGRLNVDGMNIISNDGSNKLNRSRKARVSYKV